jgi:hypothetical protein
LTVALKVIGKGEKREEGEKKESGDRLVGDAVDRSGGFESK